MMETVEIPEEMKPAMQNGLPAIVASCSADGIPNATIISQAYYVDATHIALSFQFFNKTVRNVRENPRACLSVNDIENTTRWVLHIEYHHSETEGRVFDEMDMAIEAIASMTGMSGIFSLKAADVYRVLSVRKVSSPV